MTTTPASPYANPTLNCDIVMKGGITSGVVYPRAVAELAKTYRTIRREGLSAFYRGDLAKRIVRAVRRPARPGRTPHHP